MHLGEGSFVNIVSENHDEDCYFCKASKKLTSETNDLVDDPDEDAAEMECSLSEYRFINSSGKLADALGGRPDAKPISYGGNVYWAVVAAHHLIPGGGALKHSDIMDYLFVDGSATGNIGYDVNSMPNGVWLPGNYGVRPWGTKGSVFKSKSKVTGENFAFDAIDAWGAQFHDAHKNYSNFVCSALDKIADKLRKNEIIWCPEQKKKDKDKPTQMFQIVGRLNTLSARLKRMLVFPTSGWRHNVYTSSFVQDYMIQKEHKLKKTDMANRD